MSTPPPSDRRFDADEFIAVVVALAAIGGILAWGLRRMNPEFSWSMLQAPSEAEESEETNPFALTPFTTERTPNAPIPPEATSPTIVAPPDVEDVERSPRPQATIYPVPVPPDTVARPTPAEDLPASAEDLPASTAAPTFPDVSTDYWAYPFIAGLAAQGIIRGAQDGTYQPDAPTTRAEYASALNNAFELGDYRPSASFSDISASYPARSAIDEAVKSFFMSGYPDQTFKPNQPISRLELFLSLFSGMQLLTPDNPEEVVSVYSDAAAIPDSAIRAIAAATEANLIVLPPGQMQLEPGRAATRAEVASALYQALVFQEKAQPVSPTSGVVIP